MRAESEFLRGGDARASNRLAWLDRVMADDARITVDGIGGLFVSSQDPVRLTEWYDRHLGVLPPPTSYGGEVWQPGGRPHRRRRLPRRAGARSHRPRGLGHQLPGRRSRPPGRPAARRRRRGHREPRDLPQRPVRLAARPRRQSRRALATRPLNASPQEVTPRRARTRTSAGKDGPASGSVREPDAGRVVPGVGPVSADGAQRAWRISRISWAVSDGVLPTFTPTASRASFFACAVPEEPDTIAPAWPIVLPSGAVKPAT